MNFKKIKEDLFITIFVLLSINLIVILIAKGYALTVIEKMFETEKNK